MKITRNIATSEASISIDIELTSEELKMAYWEQEHIYFRRDVELFLENNFDEIKGMDVKPVADQIWDSMYDVFMLINDCNLSYWTNMRNAYDAVVGTSLAEYLPHSPSFDNVLAIERVTIPCSDEVLDVPKDILSCNRLWWLRSPSYDSHGAAYVGSDGSVSHFGNAVSSANVCVRPAFRIANQESSYPQIGERMKIAATGEESIEVVYIGNNLWLAVEPIGESCFRKDWSAPDANCWDKSDLKRWLQKWVYTHLGNIPVV